MENPDQCAACGKTEEQELSLKMCTRCQCTKYCSRDCQVRHWKKEHKLQCEFLLFTKGKDNKETRETKDKLMKEEHKKMRKFRKENVPIDCKSNSYTVFGYVTPGLPIPNGVPPNFPLKQHARIEFQQGPSRKPGHRGNMKGEKAYKDYYDDIVDNKTQWMQFFEIKDHYEHAEHTCGILGTLATIYRQRGSFDQCEKVLDMEHEVLLIYKRHSIGADPGQVCCCEGLYFKYQMIRYNLLFLTRRYDECVKILREILGYELRKKVSFEEQQWLFMVPAILKKKPKASVLASLTNDEIMKIVLAPLRVDGGRMASPGSERDLALKTCAKCQRSEEAMQEFNKCSRCKSVFYCSKECQTNDWKEHKKTTCLK